MDREKKQPFSKMLKNFQLGARFFTENYMRAVKEGADVAEKEILESVEDRDQISEVQAGNLFRAIKLGVLHAAEQMLHFGIDLIELMKDKPSKK